MVQYKMIRLHVTCRNSLKRLIADNYSLQSQFMRTSLVYSLFLLRAIIIVPRKFSITYDKFTCQKTSILTSIKPLIKEINIVLKQHDIE